MKLKIDKEADALYVNLSDESAYESEEVSPGIVIDYNREGKAVGIEMLHLSKRVPNLDFQKVDIETIPVSG